MDRGLQRAQAVPSPRQGAKEARLRASGRHRDASEELL